MIIQDIERITEPLFHFQYQTQKYNIWFYGRARLMLADGNYEKPNVAVRMHRDIPPDEYYNLVHQVLEMYE